MAELCALTFPLLIETKFYLTSRTGLLWLLVLMPYGQGWRQRRKAFYHFFSSNAVSEYEPLLEAQTRVLLRDIAEKPDDLFAHLRL